MECATDEEHLELARQLVRVIFTQDADFLRLHATGVPHTGIAYAHQQSDVGTLIRGLMLIYEVLSPADMENHVEFCKCSHATAASSAARRWLCWAVLSACSLPMIVLPKKAEFFAAP